MSVLRETLGQQGWPGGVITATDPALLGPLASPRGRNSALAFATAGVPYVQKRAGLLTINTTAVSGSGAIIGQFGYNRLANATTYHLLVSDTGRLDKNVAGTITNISTALTAGAHYPDFAVAADLCFIVNGSDRVKFNGTTMQNFGIVRPTVGTLAGAAGAAGSPNGTYTLRVTYYNSATGAESSASDSSVANVTVTNQKISVTNIPVSADAQVTDVRIYVRNIATMTQFFLAGSVANATTTATLDFLDANLTTTAPTTISNDPPPSGAKYLAYHQGRMFVATDTALYYSQLNQPEAFNLAVNFESVNASDGQALRGIISDDEVLKIFKEDATYILIGPNPNEWEVRLVDPEMGCSSHQTLLSANGSTWWWSRHGLARMTGSTGPVERISLPLYGDPTTAVNYASILTACAAFSENQTRLYVSLPGTGASRNNFILPFNLTGGNAVLESDFWDPMDIASMAAVLDANHVPQVYFGNYAGQVFQSEYGNNDGVAAATTVTGTFVASAASMATFTDLGATFDTTGAGLIERKVMLLDANGVIFTATRPRITSNTATAFVVTPAVTNLVIGATYTYIVGGPDFAWDTPWRASGNPWLKNRYEYFWMLSKGASFGASAKIDIYTDYRDDVIARTFQSATGGALWDIAVWDVDVWDNPGDMSQRFRVGATGHVWKARVRNSAANQPFAMLYLAMQAVGETVKS